MQSRHPVPAALRTPAAESLVALTSALVRAPSQAGVDALDDVQQVLEDWLSSRHLHPLRLGDATTPLGLYLEIEGDRPGPTYVLDAPIDTAPAGPAQSWSTDPFSGEVRDGWLHGRGAADCKAGAAVFCHLAAALAERPPAVGRVGVLLDGDEHTGRFGGVRALLDRVDPASLGGVLIGYPGDDEIVVGGRGFLRARLVLRGPGGHSGSRRTCPNPAVKAADLVGALHAPPAAPDDEFPVGPKVTVTAVEGGSGFSTVPARVVVSVDVRLTPTFDAASARALLASTVVACDARHPTHPPVEVAEDSSWPAYRHGDAEPVVAALATAAEARLGRPVPRVVAGPSNIGNLLSSLGVPATAGFGVRSRGLHALDEAIDVSTLPPTFDVYAAAVARLTSA